MDYQSLIALLILAAAAAFLVRRLLWRRGGCSGCAAQGCSSRGEITPLVKLDPPRRP